MPRGAEAPAVRFLTMRRGGALFEGASVSSEAVMLLLLACAALVRRDRRRSFMGGGAYAMGGVGSCASEGNEASAGACGGGVVMSDCSERQVLTMLPKACCDEERVGGLAGGEAKRPMGRRERCGCWFWGDCDESHDSADGRSIFAPESIVRYYCIVFFCSGDDCIVVERVGPAGSKLAQTQRCRKGRCRGWRNEQEDQGACAQKRRSQWPGWVVVVWLAAGPRRGWMMRFCSRASLFGWVVSASSSVWLTRAQAAVRECVSVFHKGIWCWCC